MLISGASLHGTFSLFFSAIQELRFCSVHETFKKRKKELRNGLYSGEDMGV